MIRNVIGWVEFILMMDQQIVKLEELNFFLLHYSAST